MRACAFSANCKTAYSRSNYPMYPRGGMPWRLRSRPVLAPYIPNILVIFGKDIGTGNVGASLVEAPAYVFTES